MIKLLQLEFLKMYKNRTFLIMLSIFMLALITFLIYGDQMVAGINAKTYHRFPKIWYFNAYFTKWFAYILGVIAISAITTEISNKTLRQNIIDGMSRVEFALSKILFFAALTITICAVIFIATVATGMYNQNSLSEAVFTDNIQWIFILMLFIFGYMMLAYNIGLLVKKTGLAIVLLIVYIFMIEPALTSKTIGFISDIYMPGEALSSMLPFMFPVPPFEKPAPEMTNFIAAGTHTVILSGLSILIIKVRNL